MALEKTAARKPAGADHNALNSERTSVVHLGEQVYKSGWDQVARDPSALGPEPSLDAGQQTAAWPGPLEHCALAPAEQLAQTCDLERQGENGEYGDTLLIERTAPARLGGVLVSPLTSIFQAP